MAGYTYTLLFDQEGGTKEISANLFTMTVSSGQPSWCTEISPKISSTIGLAADVTVNSYSGDEERNSVVKFSNGDTLFLRQKGAAPLSVESSSVSFSDEAGSKEIPLNRGNYPGDITIKSSNPEVFHAYESVDGDAIVIEAKTNNTRFSRSGTITISTNEYITSPAKISIKQYREEFLELSETSRKVTSSGGEFRVKVEIDGDDTSVLSVESDSDWVRASITGNSLWIEYDENTSRNRSAVVTVNYERAGLSATYVISQLNTNAGIETNRLTTWQHSADSAYIINYGAGADSIVFTIWDEATRNRIGEAVLDDFRGDIDDLRMCVINDVVYIVHPDFRPKKLTRVDDGKTESGYAFTLSDFEVKIDPVLDEYADRNVFRVQDGSFNVGDTVRITELSLTDGQKRNNAELLFTGTTSWRGTERQMIMLKRPTEMMKSYAFCFPDSENNSATLMQVPKPATVFQDTEGGKGKSSPWLFVFGKITVESAGKWSGRIVVDLWKPDMEVDDYGEPVSPERLAVIEVSNASANKSISRDLNIIGSRIRIRCEEREKAQAVSATTDGSGNIAYKSVDNDSGCFITLSNAQEVPVYLRIVSVIAPTDEADGYAYCEAIHPFEGGFNSSSFAEGAWSKTRYGYPRTCGIFQERMVFAGNKVKPCTLWCSKTGDWANFVQGSESTSPIFATANTDNIDSIQWMQTAKSYIMFGSLSGEWYFGGSDSSALKPSNYSFQRLSNFGSTRGVDVVLFGDSTLVAKNGGKQVIDVSYNTLSEQGSGTNLSLFAQHLFEESSIADMASTISPTGILWVLRNDGVLLSFTYEASNNVFAWARHDILDGVMAITSFRRNERDVLAILVRDGTETMLAELDPYRGDDYVRGDESVFSDENSSGELVRYESRVIPTPIALSDGVAYGRKVAFKNLDVYLKTHNGDFDADVWAEGTQFSVKLGSGDSYVCDNGWLRSNVMREFGENKVRLSVSGGWDDKALVDIRTDYPAPLTITALGADFSVGG